MKEFIKKYQDIAALAGLVLLTLPVLAPYFHSGFFPTHDGEWAVVRLADMFRTLRDGQFPARYSGYLNSQYGYPLFNFAYPLPYYLGMVFVLLKLGFVSSIKILFVLSTLISVGGMYFLASRMWKSTFAGFLSAVLFLYLPYRMVDLFVRGSLGEAMALAIVPCMFLSVYFAIKKRSVFSTVVTALLLGALIPTHNIMSLLFTPIFFAYALFLSLLTDKKTIVHVLVAVVLGVGISAFFWIPAIVEKGNILLSTIPIADRSLYFVNLQQLVFPSWGYGIPTDIKDPFTYHIGVAQIIGFLLAIFVLTKVVTFQKKMNMRRVAALFVGIIIVSVLMVFEFSAKVWEITPLLSEINYPWTLIGPIGFLTSLVAGFAITKIKHGSLVGFGIGLLAIILVLPYAHPREYVDRGDDFYVTNAATTTSSQEYTPLWVKELPVQAAAQKVVVTQGDAAIEHISSSSNRVSFTITATNSAVFQINTIYYPGWELDIDGKEADLSYDNPRGVMEGSVSAGQHIVMAEFTETPIRRVANVLTIGSLLMCLLVVIRVGIRHLYGRN